MKNMLSAAVVAALAMMVAAPAGADALTRDRVHADSFGNLVIYSAAGYKRILVGKGYAAEAYNRHGSYYEPEGAQTGPEVVYLEEERPRSEARRCHRPPYLWHGRSYMYGLPDHVIPQPPLVCK